MLPSSSGYCEQHTSVSVSVQSLLPEMGLLGPELLPTVPLPSHAPSGKADRLPIHSLPPAPCSFFLVGGKWHLVGVYLIRDVECLFTGLLAIGISSLEEYLLKSFAYLLVRLLCCYWVVCVLHPIWISTPSLMYHLQMSSPVLWLPLYSVERGFFCFCFVFSF